MATSTTKTKNNNRNLYYLAVLVLSNLVLRSLKLLVDEFVDKKSRDEIRF